MKTLLLGTCLFSLALLAPALHAQTIPNPSFETNGLENWTATGTVSVVQAGTVADNGAIPNGSHVAALSCPGPTTQATISTTITGLVVGGHYRVSCRVNVQESLAAVGAGLTVQGAALATKNQQAVGGSAAYDTFAGVFTASATTATLEVSANSTVNAGTLLVDDFRIVRTDVLNTANSGPGSLRQALADAAAAPGADIIGFDSALAGQTISLDSAIAIVDADGVTVDASTVPGIVINDGVVTSHGLFAFAQGTNVTFLGLTLADGGGVGYTFGGAAILNLGTLNLERCTLTGNSAPGVTNSSIGGAIQNQGTLKLTHCTLTDNWSGNKGGAIHNTGTLTLTHCTLTGNAAAAGGGLYNEAGTLTLQNTIVADNTDTAAGTSTDNISGTFSGSNNLTSGYPDLDSLKDNGGPTRTMALLPGSPALDAGAVLNPVLTTDQRGFDRNRDGNAVAGALPDIGAYEAQAAPTAQMLNPIVVTTTADENDPNGTLGGGVSLREALRDGGPAGIIFDAALDGQTITLTSGLDLPVYKSVTIDASALVAGLTIAGGSGTNRIFTVASGQNVSLVSLTLRNGHGHGQDLFVGGGAISNHGTLTLTNCTLTGSSTATFGGAIFNDTTGTLTLTGCQFGLNHADNAGGAIHNVGTLTLTSCTLALNSATNSGGAIMNNGPLTATNCTFTSNTAKQGGALDTLYSGGQPTLTGCTFTANIASTDGNPSTGLGGAIYNENNLALTGCTFASNRTAGTLTLFDTTSGYGGAIYNPAGKVLTATNCTFTGNSSVYHGGAIANFGSFTITHCTLVENAASFPAYGGAIVVGGGTLSLGYSIVAGNTASSGPDIYKPASGGGTITPVGTNLIGKNNTVMAQFPQGPLVGVDALPVVANLAALASNGGPTQTMVPQPGSLAIDAAAGSATTKDQRNFDRPKDGDGNGSVVADLGAVERGTLLLPVVSTTADSGPGSLRQAFADAATVPDTTITFAPGFTGPIVFASEIVVPANAVITVDGSNVTAGLVLSGGGASRIFDVDFGNLTLKGVTLTGGNGTGAISSFGGAFGGAISNFGTLTLTQCTLSGNSAANYGGAISNDGTLTLTQCTLSGNSASNYGGAISNAGTLTLTQCTLSGNSATNIGGAIYNHANFFIAATLTLTNTIVAGNFAPSGPDIRATGSITPTGNNLIGNVADSGLTAGTHVIEGAANLTPLGHYGGRTPTMLPLAGSPAIDAGDNAEIPAGVTTDQRGSFLWIGTSVDIGAVERGYVVTSADDSGANTLRQAVTSAGSVGSIVINFDPALEGATIPLASRIPIDKNLEINAEGLPNGITLDGGSLGNRLLRVFTGRTVALHKLKLINGGGTSFNQFGGGIINDGKLTLTRCTLSGNKVKAGNSGGAISSGFGSTLALTDCTLSGNSADFGGAIQTVATATLNRCTLNNNTASNGNGGAISGNVSTVSLTQCTVTGNTATGGQGGGVFCLGSYLTMIHCTIVGNTTSGSGGGVFADGNNAGGFAIANTIVAGNAATTSGPDFYESGNFSGGNLNVSFTGRVFIGDLGTPATSGFSADDKVLTTAQNGPVKLSALGDYGGPTQTMVPLAGSPVLNQASNDLRVGAAISVNLPTDQRGLPRLVGAAADLGAVERTPRSLIVTHSSDTGPSSLRQTMLHPEATAIAFDPILNGQTVTLTSGEIVLPSTSNVTVDASSLPAGLTVSGNNASRIFTVSTGASLTLRCLTLSGGNGTGALADTFAGALYNNGTTTLERCTFTGNTATVGGAIQNQNAGALLTATQCTFAGNTATSATSGGGAITTSTSATTNLIHCTIAGNAATGANGVGGGLRRTAGTVTLTNCVVASNTAVTDANIFGGMMTVGANFVPAGTGGTFTGPAPISTGDPLLAPLASYGGPTQTMALKPGSPARNTATVLTPALTADQRGFAIVGQPDIGAYEAGTLGDFDAFAAETGTSADPNADPDQDGNTALMEYATRGNTSGFNGNPIGEPQSTTVNGSTPAVHVSFPYRPEARDLRYCVERSTNLLNWTEILRLDTRTREITELGNVAAEENSTTRFIIVTDPDLIGDRTMYRLVVERP